MIDKVSDNKAVFAEPITSRHLNTIGCKLGLPISGTFELTARCNFSCRMCYVHQQVSKESELSAEEWIDLGRRARDNGMMFLLLTGGEPLLREDFPYIYSELVKMGILVSINTNASLYNDELRELFLRYPPSRINVTLYGGSEETYCNLCRNPSFEKVVHNLKRMKADNLQVRLNLSLTPYNVSDISKIDAISREIGLQVKAASYMYPQVRVNGLVGENEARFTPEEAGSAIAQWQAIREDRDVFVKKAELLKNNLCADFSEICTDPEQEGVLCRAGRSSFWMTWDGRMLPCGTMDIEASYPLRDGFEKAWNEVLERTAEIRMPKECASCSKRVNCGMCASICKCETGSFDGVPKYMCRLTEKRIDKIIELAEEMK